MNKKTIFLFVPFFVLVVLFVRCNNKSTIYKNYTEIPGFLWDKNQDLPFSFEISDTTPEYEVKIHVRHTNAYQHETVPVLFTMQNPSGETTRVPADIHLKDEKGKFTGDAAGDIWDFCCFTAIESTKFKKGKYKVVLQHTYSKPILMDIMGMGIEVSKK